MIAFETDLPKLKKTKLYSLDEYLVREERSLHKHEYFNGKILRMPGSKYKHNQIASNVIRFLGNELEKIETAQYITINSDQKIYIEAENVSVYPDALVIAEKPIFWQDREDLLINPLVIVEVASKGTRLYDRGEKFLLYKNIPTFREYVLIEQDTFKVETWYKQDAETWKVSVVNDLEQDITLRAVNVSLRLKDIYKHLY